MKKNGFRKIEEKIMAAKLLLPGDRVLLACSGGADSLCLFYCLLHLREKLGFTFSVAHVHHGLRGASADRDLLFTGELSEKHGIPFYEAHVDTLHRVAMTGETPEEAARNLRYRALFDLAQEAGAEKIALAHHADDQAETVLFRMLRGTGLKGFSGMTPAAKAPAAGITLIRPFLSVTKKEILTAMTEENLLWQEDETNALDDAVRNRIRHGILPMMQTLYEDAAEKICALSKKAAVLNDFAETEARKFFSASDEEDKGAGCAALRPGEELLIPAERFNALHEALKPYVLREAFRIMELPLKDQGEVHLAELSALFDKPVGKQADLPGGITGRRTYDGVVLVRRKEPVPETLIGTMPDYRIRVFPFEKNMKIPEKQYTKWFDYDKIKRNLPVLRRREEGDLFSTLGGTHKKLKDYLIDEKIPREERDSLPLFAVEKEVLWVVGYRMNENFKVTEETGNVLEIQVEKEV